MYCEYCTTALAGVESGCCPKCGLPFDFHDQRSFDSIRLSGPFSVARLWPWIVGVAALHFGLRLVLHTLASPLGVGHGIMFRWARVAESVLLFPGWPLISPASGALRTRVVICCVSLVWGMVVALLVERRRVRILRARIRSGR